MILAMDQRFASLLRFESTEISDKDQCKRVLDSWHKLIENVSGESAISTNYTTALVLLVPPVLYLPRTLLLDPSRSKNTETSNRKDGRIIQCETGLEAGILVEKASNGSALSTNYKTILCVASISRLQNDLAPRLHIPRISNVETSDKDLEKSFNAEIELEAGI